MSVLISVSDLREEIGGPTKDEASPGYISNTTLQNIIDRHQSALDAAADEKIKRRIVAGEPLLSRRDKTEEAVSLTQDGEVATGDLPTPSGGGEYVPYSRDAIDGSDRRYEWDEQIEETQRISWVDSRRFTIRDDKVIVIPNDTGSINLWLSTYQQVKEELMADMIVELNASIVDQATKAVIRRHKEGNRQAGILEGDE